MTEPATAATVVCGGAPESTRHIGIDPKGHRYQPTTAAPPLLRVGRKVKRTIYVQRGPEPSDADRIVGLMDDGTLAAAVVAAFNRQSANDRTYWLDGLDG